MSLSSVPSEQPDATCANCGAQLVADQRYCLSCGQPVSPVRLAFLDVLAPAAPAPAGSAPAAWGAPAGWAAPATIEAAPGSYVTLAPQQGANAWLRRNSGLLALIGILGLFLLAGLLVGHWVSASKTPANTTVKIEGLGGLAAAGTGTSGTGSTTTGSTSTGSGSGSNPAAAAASTPKQEKAATEEAKKIEKQPLAKPKKATTQINKLSKSHGKKHQEEINALGAEPIETG